MLVQLKGPENSIWGLSANTWKSAYTGMIRELALWGAEFGWRGQRHWEKEFEKLQYQVLKKCGNVTYGSEENKLAKSQG